MPSMFEIELQQREARQRLWNAAGRVATMFIAYTLIMGILVACRPVKTDPYDVNVQGGSNQEINVLGGHQ